jgi:hypothetical protein
MLTAISKYVSVLSEFDWRIVGDDEFFLIIAFSTDAHDNF